MKNILASFPDQQSLLELFPETETLAVNAHIHTPYSFSAFRDIRQAFEMAQKENIAVLGINDFFMTDGYDSFYQEALNYGIFPLFNIEFISLLKKEQKDGIRINDPNNPGRCYFSGKGLDFPYSLTDPLHTKLEKVVAESQDQVRAMIDKANKWFARIDTNIRLSYDDIRRNYAKELVRERHVAKAIRMAVFDQSSSETDRIAWFIKIFDGKAPKSELNDIPGLENEIRGNLLKAGGKAFVEEDDNAFMSLEEVIEIITHAGGIPCYPVLLDDRNGNYTEYEKDPEFLRQELRKYQIGCIELIPGRNDATHLEKFVNFFHDKGFVILLGTEHNAPDMIPITCDTRGRKPLSPEMQRISYEGSCVVAAHQYLKSKGLKGFLNDQSMPGTAERDSFVKLGNTVIHHFVKSFKRDQ
ncbi:MAG: hypothetical protein JW830_09660 [Bacteroidales bacterium]|nr:hypothetical protein [Bacteroidales bacterium]